MNSVVQVKEDVTATLCCVEWWGVATDPDGRNYHIIDTHSD